MKSGKYYAHVAVFNKFWPLLVFKINYHFILFSSTSSFSSTSFSYSCSTISPTHGRLAILQTFRHFTYVTAILQPFRRSTYDTAHSPTLPLLHLRHSSFSNPSFASPTSQSLHLRHLANRPCFYSFLTVSPPSHSCSSTSLTYSKFLFYSLFFNFFYIYIFFISNIFTVH